MPQARSYRFHGKESDKSEQCVHEGETAATADDYLVWFRHSGGPGGGINVERVNRVYNRRLKGKKWNKARSCVSTKNGNGNGGNGRADSEDDDRPVGRFVTPACHVGLRNARVFVDLAGFFFFVAFFPTEHA